MCKVTRNARSGVSVSVRQGASAQQHNHTRTYTGAQSIQEHPHTIHGKTTLEQMDEKLAVLPQDYNQKKVEQQRPQLVDEMQQENGKQIAQNGHSAASSTAVAQRPASACSSVATSSSNNKTSAENMNASLRALSALCLQEAPNVVTGALIRECLLGQVSLGSYALGNNQFLPVVVKEFDLGQVLNKTTKNGQSLHEDALVELQIHAYIQKKQVKNVIGLYAMHINQATGKLYAYLEYAAKGELFSMLQARGTPLPLSVSGNFLVQLLQGVASLHSINVVHRDLSLENVLLTGDNEVKICDFGLATISASGDCINDGRTVGKVKYMCPEVYYGEGYDARLADVWSTAVIFFLLLTNVFPYERPSADDPRLVMLCHGQINQLLAHWQRPALDDELLEVFSHMFCPPQQRWSAAQLLQLPFCQRYANVSKAELAAALAPKTSAAAADTNRMSADDCIPAAQPSSHCRSTSPPSCQVGSPSVPVSPVMSAGLSDWSDHSSCPSEDLPNCSSTSVSPRASYSVSPHCQTCKLSHAYSEPCLVQQAQMETQQFHTPASLRT